MEPEVRYGLCPLLASQEGPTRFIRLQITGNIDHAMLPLAVSQPDNTSSESEREIQREDKDQVWEP